MRSAATLVLGLVMTTAMSACSRGSAVPVAAASSGSAAPAAAPVEASPASSPSAAPAATPTAGHALASAPAADPAPAPAPAFEELEIPAGTRLAIELRSSVASDTSRVEDPVRGRLTRALRIRGTEAAPAGTAVLGTITEVDRSARVKGRARVAFRFTRLERPGGAVAIRTAPLVYVAEATKKQDAAKIGGAAAGGAIIGGILGGGDGAAKGAAIGGTAGTGVVLSTRGKEVRVPAGTVVSARISRPFTVRVPAR